MKQQQLPRDGLEKELRRFEEMGIHFELDRALGRDVTAKELRRKYAAVVIS